MHRRTAGWLASACSLIGEFGCIGEDAASMLNQHTCKRAHAFERVRQGGVADGREGGGEGAIGNEGGQNKGDIGRYRERFPISPYIKEI